VNTGGVALLELGDSYVACFTALAHRTRLAVLSYLADTRREVTAGTIQAASGVPAPTLSHHLKIMRAAGLIEGRREDRHIYYSIKPDNVLHLIRWLTDCCPESAGRG
jgi:ArsR family transcriptional regulator